MANAYKKCVIVPAGYRLNSAPYVIERGGKPISLTCCISPLGLVRKPQFSVPRTHGVISNVIRCITEIYYKTIVIPALNELRERSRYYGKAFLIVDGYRHHQHCFRSLELSNDMLN